MRIPDDVRIGLRVDLWNLADKLDWARLSWMEKTHYYESWTKDAAIGGKLSNYMDERQVRVYIKDTIMKGYVRSRMANAGPALKALGLSFMESDVVAEYDRPHGRLLKGGKMVAWARAKEWKAVLMALYERAYLLESVRPYGAVLFAATGRFEEDDVRAMVSSAAKKLEVENLVWLR